MCGVLCVVYVLWGGVWCVWRVMCSVGCVVCCVWCAMCSVGGVVCGVCGVLCVV